MAKTTTKTETQAAYEKDCPCGFLLRDHNAKEFAQIMILHVKSSHGQTLDEKAAMVGVRRV